MARLRPIAVFNQSLLKTPHNISVKAVATWRRVNLRPNAKKVGNIPGCVCTLQECE